MPRGSSKSHSWILCLANCQFANAFDFAICWDRAVRDLAVLFLQLLATVARLAGPGGVRAVVAESVLVTQPLLILNRSRKRSPTLRLGDRVVAGVCTRLMRPSRLVRAAIVLKPSTLLRFHRALTTRKYRQLFSTAKRKTPGPKGPSRKVIAAVPKLIIYDARGRRAKVLYGAPPDLHQQIEAAVKKAAGR